MSHPASGPATLVPRVDRADGHDAPRTDAEVDLRLTVARRTVAADDVVVLDLRDPSGAALPAWTPGAHVDLILPGGVVRQYSLCGDPDDRGHWRVGVLREPDGRGGSALVHDTLHEGSAVEVRGPRNHFELVPAQQYLFVAGGIGITPIVAMITAAQRRGVPWALHYGGRSRTSMAFLDRLAPWLGAEVTLHPQDEVGLIDLDQVLATPRGGTAVYCCGPEPLLAAVEQRCASWPGRPLHVERFAPKQVGEPVRTDSFEVHLARTGTTLTVPPQCSILETVEAAGVSVLSSCREGTCGTCETAVLEGRVEHRDSLLTPDEQAAHDTMFICVSRAACPRLVLDL